MEEPNIQHTGAMITISALHKSFGKLQVLKGTDLHIELGKVTAIVGPNGSGKSTLIKSILGLVRPDSGDIMLAGESIRGRWDYRKAIGYMPQIARFPDNLTVKEVLDMIRDIREAEQNDSELIEWFNLEKEMGKQLRVLSGGTRQKVNAAIAFLFNPDLYILDEPTAGLDPVSSSRLKDKIMAERNKGKTVILTSHIMSELEELSDNIVFLLEGTILFQGTVSRMIQESGEINLERAIAHILERGYQ